MTCRALHDSLVNHGQGDPELILTLYEEIAGDLPLAVGSACGSSTSTERARMVRRGIAALTRVDALDFRLRRLTNPRGLGVLRAMAARMGWPPRPSPRPAAPGAAVLPGRGLAYVHYKHDETLVAMGMEVEVERASGRIRVTRVVCVQDCGLVINPDNVRSQVEGNVLQTLSRALHGDVVFDRQRVTTVTGRATRS